MENHINHGLQQGKATNRPPLFSTFNYPYWKIRMMHYIKGATYDLWLVMEEGDRIITRPKVEWDREETELASPNARALSLIFCALSPDEFDKVCNYSNAKEI